jgi:5'-nucleotidase
MSAPHLTLAIASSALFDLAAADAVYRSEGREAYRAYQLAHETEVLAPGVAFPFVRRLLNLNRFDPAQPLVEVVLLSRNDTDTGLRVSNSLVHHGLKISRMVFTSGRPPWPYIDVFEASLFLSANQDDVEEAIRAGYAAGTVLPSAVADDGGDELRIAFDFDGVLADDAGEQVYQSAGLAGFHANEHALAHQPLAPGPLKRLLAQLAAIQAIEAARRARDPAYLPLVRTIIVTARSAPADRRVVTTLRDWGIRVDESCFVGDLPKDRVLRKLRPHLFFDDKRGNADLAASAAPSVHVPFGAINRG